MSIILNILNNYRNTSILDCFIINNIYTINTLSYYIIEIFRK